MPYFGKPLLANRTFCAAVKKLITKNNTMKNIFDKFFCNHKWKTHHKREMKSTIFMPNIIGDGLNKTELTKEFTREVLICENCGKIKQIEY